MRQLETVLEKSVVVPPNRFLELLRKRRGDIERVSIRPPRLGGRGFGRIVVEYKHGVWRALGANVNG
jgi:hypothetical protein